MGLIAKDSSDSITPAPQGLWPAVCVDVVDLGLVQTTFEGKTSEKPMVQFRWQINQVNPETGKRFLVVQRYVLSLHEKSNLAKILTSWRGTPFTPAELRDGFDLERVLGANCQLMVVHRLGSGNRVYANVQTIVPPADNMPLMTPLDYQRVVDRPKANGNGHGATPAEQETVPATAAALAAAVASGAISPQQATAGRKAPF